MSSATFLLFLSSLVTIAMPWKESLCFGHQIIIKIIITLHTKKYIIGLLGRSKYKYTEIITNELSFLKMNFCQNSKLLLRAYNIAERAGNKKQYQSLVLGNPSWNDKGQLIP